MADEIVVRIRAEGQEQFVKDLKKSGVAVEKVGDTTEKTTNKMESSFSSLGKTIGAAMATGALIAFARDLTKTAISIDSTNKKIQIVFGESAKAVEDFAKKSATSLGLTTNEFKKAAAAIGDLLIPIGFQRKEAAKLSNDLVNLSGALAAWTGGQLNASQVSEILTKALLGEREQLKQLGIQISEADIKTKLLEKGQQNLTGSAEKQAKALASLELITEKSSDAQAAFADDTKTLAESQLELTANLRELKESLANGIIPILTKTLGIVNDSIEGWKILFDTIGSVGDSIDPFATALQDIDKNSSVQLVQLKDNLEGVIETLAADKGRSFKESFALGSARKELQKVNKLIEEMDINLDLVRKTAGQTAGGVRGVGSGITAEPAETLRTLNLELKALKEQLKDIPTGTEEFDTVKGEIDDLIAKIKKLTSGPDKKDTDKAAAEWLAFFENSILNALKELDTQEIFDRTDLGIVDLDIDFDLTKAIERANFDKLFDIGDGDLDIDTSGVEAEGEAVLKASAENQKKITKQAQEEQKARRDSSIDAVSTAFDVASGFIALEIQQLQAKYDAGLIGEKEFQREKSELLTKQARANKANAVFEIGLNTAAAITSALRAGPIIGPILAAVVGGLAAAQLAQVLAAPIPQFAEGTRYVDGKGYPNGVDTVPAMLTKGERVLTVSQNKEHWNLLNALESNNTDAMAKAIAGYGIPVQFKTTYDELYKPMSAMHQLVKDTPLEGIDWNPLLMSNETSRRSAGRKLDKIYMEMVRLNNGLTRRMTKA